MRFIFLVEIWWWLAHFCFSNFLHVFFAGLSVQMLKLFMLVMAFFPRFEA